MNPVNPFTDHHAIERRLLELAYTTDAKLTATALAYYAPCSIEDASRVLDDLAAHDRLEMEILDDGSIVYHLRGRERLAFPHVTPTPPPPPPFSRSLAPSVGVRRPPSSLSRHPS